ncbi:MAG: tRNA pseudouridine(55) synthase TruB [Candidatus Aminicenantaceae bacterium]
MDGLILINKKQGCTSHDVIVEIRKILHIRKIGHFGTLDPLATGLMLVAVGKATRLFPYFSKADKLYNGQIRLGISTDTYDSMGKPISREKKELPEKSKILEAIKEFEGAIDQIPPPYSAKKYRGKPLYTLARKEKEFELRPSQVFIHFFKLRKYHPPLLDFEVKCSSGTYIRSLAQDLGQILGCGAHLSTLTRIEVGSFKLSNALSLEEIKKFSGNGRTEHFLIPLEFLLPQFPKIILKETCVPLVKNGNMVSNGDIVRAIHQDSSKNSSISQEQETIFRLFSLDGKLIALAKKIPDKNILHPFLVIS